MSAKDTSTETKSRKTRDTTRRSSLRGQRTLLEVRGKEPGYHYAWIGEDYVFAALEDGYEHVRHPVQVGSKRIDVTELKMESHIVRPVGGGKRAFLMRLPEEIHQQYIADEQQQADEQMAARLGEFNRNGLTGEVDAYATVGKTSKT